MDKAFIAAKLCQVSYHPPSSYPPETLEPFYSGTDNEYYFHHYRAVNTSRYLFRIPLSRNLLGTKGICQVLVEVLHSEKTMFVAFSGTSDLEYWLYNLGTTPVPFCGLQVHEGFASLAMEVTEYMMKSDRSLLFGESVFDIILNVIKEQGIKHVIFTGHSAGGCLATLVPTFLLTFIPTIHNPFLPTVNGPQSATPREPSPITWEVIDFGTPRFIAAPHTGENWGPALSRRRFHHVLDIVPHVPPMWTGPGPAYHHWGSSWILSRKGRISSPTAPSSATREVVEFVKVVLHYTGKALTGRLGRAIVDNHAMNTYINLLTPSK